MAFSIPLLLEHGQSKRMIRLKCFSIVFSAGMKAILEKDSHGIKHFKYIVKSKNPNQLEMKLGL